MFKISNYLAVVLFLGLLATPIHIWAEDNGDTSSAADFSALQASISSPADNAVIQTGTAVTFAAAAAGGEPPYAYTWDFGDGTTAFGQSYSKTYVTAGVRTVALKITDFAGRTAEAAISVLIRLPVEDLQAAISSPADNAVIQTGAAVTFAAAAAGGEPPYAYTWDFGDGTTAFGQSYSKTYVTAGVRTVALKITDFAGRTAEAEISVTIAAPSQNDADTTAPSQPIIASSTITANSTSTSGALTIAWTSSVDPIVSDQTTSGLAGYSYVIDHDFGTIPDSTVDTTAVSFTQSLPAGAWWFHLIAKDNAANVSTPATHYGPMFVAATGGTTTEPLFISDIQVTDVTYNSAVVRWTTNRAASSRVVYDTVSHPSIAGQSAPNFGYASSTETMNVDAKVVEHAVSVTNLQPSTTYYFRVLSQ